MSTSKRLTCLNRYPLSQNLCPIPQFLRHSSQKRSQKEDDDPNARARGAVTHRLLEHLGKENSLPQTAAVVAALVSEGVLETEAQELAEEILQEIRRLLTGGVFQLATQQGPSPGLL